MKKILITGPECGGKTYLSHQLSQFFNGIYVPEYARSFLENKLGYVETDLLNIALGQHQLEIQAMCDVPPLVVCDTGIEVLYIWSEIEFHRVDPKIVGLLALDSYDLIIVCVPNIPWEEDPLRVYRYQREWLLGIYEQFFNYASNCV